MYKNKLMHSSLQTLKVGFLNIVIPLDILSSQG